MDLPDQLRHAFPVEPVEEDFFSPGCSNTGEFSDELRSHVYGRKWTDVTMYDWNCISHTNLPHLLTPHAAHYYAPSLLTATLSDLGYLYLGLEALLPHNQWHKLRGKWWPAYFALFDKKQTAAIQNYLLFAKEQSVAGGSEEYLADLALSSIWAKT